MGVLLLLIAELQSVNAFVLIALAVVLLVGRICHGYAFAFTAALQRASPVLRLRQE